MHGVFSDMFAYIKQYDMYLTRISEGDKIENGTKNL